MGKLYSIRYNNTQYTFIETLEFNNKQLLHFASSNNDSILFGYINNQLIKIDDEIKEKILEKYYPYNNDVLFSAKDFLKDIIKGKETDPDYTDIVLMTDNEKEEIINRYLFEISKHNLPEREIRRRFSEFTFYYGKPNPKLGIIGGMVNHSAKSFYVSNFVKKNNLIYHVIHHEVTHITQGYDKNQFLGFIEGETEVETQRTCFGDVESMYEGFFHYNFCGSYLRQQAIIRQMEYVTNTSVIPTAILGGTAFYDNFANIYGKDLLVYLGKRTTRLTDIRKSKFKTTEEADKYFRETQQLLLERVFNYEFKKVNSLESAEVYFNKLLNFQLVRAREKNDTLQTYYLQKLKDVVNILKSMNIGEEKIIEFINNHQYKQLPFSPRYIPPAIKERHKKMGYTVLEDGAIVLNEQAEKDVSKK